MILDFITPEEEANLLQNIQISGSNKKNTKSRNSIRRFGSSDPYKANVLSPHVPEYFNFLLDRLVDKKFVDIRPNSVTINEYMEGQEITAHIDSKTSGEIISVLSLLSDATMGFCRPRRQEKHLVELPNRSLVQMRGVIRHDWQHFILPVKAKRYSIVFRLGNK